MDSARPDITASINELKFPSHRSRSRTSASRHRRNRRKEQILNTIALISILGLLVASYVLLAQGCASDEPPASAPAEGFRRI